MDEQPIKSPHSPLNEPINGSPLPNLPLEEKSRTQSTTYQS
jgi:hypothetical protein